jgi:hypothetical protein
MPDVARDPAALERLRVQRSRLADRMRPPWWYLLGLAILYGLFFAGPFISRSFTSPRSLSTWLVLVPGVAVLCLLGWGLTRATGIKVGPGARSVLRDGVFHYRPGRPAGIAIFVVTLVGLGAETSLIRHGLTAAAIAVAVLAVTAEVAAQLALLQAIRQDLRAGGGVA